MSAVTIRHLVPAKGSSFPLAFIYERVFHCLPSDRDTTLHKSQRLVGDDETTQRSCQIGQQCETVDDDNNHCNHRRHHAEVNSPWIQECMHVAFFQYGF